MHNISSKQETIYHDTAYSIIEFVLEGYNGTIFAYGQTGTGKTHTMSGSDKDAKQRGIMPRAFEDIFRRIEQDSIKT
jgi:kinesin family protein 3/17